MKRSCLNFVCAAPENVIQDGKFQRKDEHFEAIDWFLSVHQNHCSRSVKNLFSIPHGFCFASNVEVTKEGGDEEQLCDDDRCLCGTHGRLSMLNVFSGQQINEVIGGSPSPP
jgi:hypothetical protein